MAAREHGEHPNLLGRLVAIEQGKTSCSLKIAALIRCQDGSEVAERELEDRQRLFERTWEKALALRLMAEAAAECFERETGSAYTPLRGDRTTKRALETGAVFEAKRLLERADREAAQRHACEGTRIAVAGDYDWADVAAIWDRLDRALAKRPDLILCHRGAPGAERIAAAWARARKVRRILFRPNWDAHGSSAPYKANDEIVAARLDGAIVFGSAGVALNLADKAEARGLHAARIARPKPQGVSQGDPARAGG